MELLSPASTPARTGDVHMRSSFPASFGHGIGLSSSQVQATGLPEIADVVAGRVHVAVGKSVEKSIGLLNWTFQHLNRREVALLHVHQPSPTIPTLLGKLPASQASEEVVLAHRREEMEQTKKLLYKYLSICYRSKVTAGIVVLESGQVQKGILEIVSRYGVKKLVMGTSSDSCMKVKSSTKANYIAKNAPTFCEIWFVNKKKHLWTREAFERSSSLPDLSQPETARTRSFGPKLSNSCSSEVDSIPGCPSTISCSSFRNSLTSDVEEGEVLTPKDELRAPDRIGPSISQSSTSLTTTVSEPTSLTDDKMASLESQLYGEQKKELDILYNKLIEAQKEADESKEEALSEIMKCKKSEYKAAEAINRMKTLEAASASEVKLREEVESELSVTKQDHENLLAQKDEAVRELEKTLGNLAILEGDVREAAHRRDKAAGELKLIQASIMSLRQNKKRIRRQREEALRQLERLKIRSSGRAGSSNPFVGLVDDLHQFTSFSVSDLQTATCNFSDSFKIGQGGYGCVYKGEMLGKSVAIKKLHPLNVQGRSDFQQEVRVISKLRHPHLVTLIGACWESWSLVHEYIPNGNLQDCLFRKTNAPRFTWEARIQIAAAISNALLFLHSSKPERIIHGDLKPENILLDSEFKCKISDFGMSRILPEDSLRCPSFRQNTETKGAFPYTDPEFLRTGELTPKSDVYSFGIIVLQLLTGRTPEGLTTDVRRAISSGKMSSILDPSARDWPTSVARKLAELGIQCSEVLSRDRPQLTPAMVRELGRLHIAEERPVPSYFLCPILQEIMHDPHVAADGFTYEGEALRGWLENGRETSPMTNLKLSDLNLIPNHTLRFAIQEWLCKS